MIKLIVFLLFISCASARPIQHDITKQTWVMCNDVYHGKKLLHRGFCYWTRHKVPRRIIGNKTPRKLLFCANSDMICINRLIRSGKKELIKEAINVLKMENREEMIVLLETLKKIESIINSE